MVHDLKTEVLQHRCIIKFEVCDTHHHDASVCWCHSRMQMMSARLSDLTNQERAEATHQIIYPPPSPYSSPSSLRLSDLINHLCVYLCVKRGVWGRQSCEVVSGTGGQGHSLPHLGSFSPSALDRRTCIHPPAHKRGRRHTKRICATHLHAYTAAHTQP